MSGDSELQQIMIFPGHIEVVVEIILVLEDSSEPGLCNGATFVTVGPTVV